MPISRDQLQAKDLWNVASYYKNPQTWQEDYDSVAAKNPSSLWDLIEIARDQLPKIERAKTLLDAYFTLQNQIAKLLTYAHLKRDEDTASESGQARYAKADDLYRNMQVATSWIEPQFISLGSALRVYSDSALLKEHRLYLKKLLRRQAHSLPVDQEKLLALSQKALQCPHLAFSALNDADLKFAPAKDAKGQEHELTMGTYAPHLRSQDRALRQSAFENLHSSYRDHRHLIAQLLEGNCQVHAFQARARHFKSSLHAALFEDDVAPEIYTNLISTVKARAASLERYLLLRKKILGVDQLQTWDLQVPLVSADNERFTFEEASDAVIAASAPLGDAYVRALKRGLGEDRWVDRIETPNKRSGAYSSGCWGQHPLILLNFQGALQDVFTLAHEAGHSMHSYFSWQAQPFQTGDYSIFAAEVASTLNEELLLAHLLKKASTKAAKARLIYQKIEEIRATLFRQTLFAEFEWRIHQLCERGEGLTPSALDRLYSSLNAEYCRGACATSDLSDGEWARIPHFYYNFYVFQYATGISAALDLSAQLQGVEADVARDRYLEFLRSGGSAFPVDQLRRAGVDMAAKTPIAAALDRFEALVQELELLLT